MKTEIRKEVRDYILSEVNLTLSRLGISEKIVETEEWEDNCRNNIKYRFESPAIKQMPVMFKKLIVEGYMVVIEPKDENDRFYAYKDKADFVVVNLDYSYKHFDMGSNGCSIGRMIFRVDKNLPESFESKFFGRTVGDYVYKIEGLKI